MDLNDPTTVAILGADALERGGFSYALYGGLLVAAYGEPRETRDADFAVIDVTVEQAGQALRTAGIDTHVAFDSVQFGGLLVSRLTLLGSGEFTGLNTIDLVRPRSERYAREALGRAARAPLRGRRLRVLALEDFLIFKALSTRDRDLEDAASALRRNRDLVDSRWIESELGRLASEMPDFDVKTRYARIEALGNSSP